MIETDDIFHICLFAALTAIDHVMDSLPGLDIMTKLVVLSVLVLQIVYYRKKIVAMNRAESSQHDKAEGDSESTSSKNEK